MKGFCEFCLKVKVFAVELTVLVSFLGILGFVLFIEWRHLVAWAR